jgi:hypothetical protein
VLFSPIVQSDTVRLAEPLDHRQLQRNADEIQIFDVACGQRWDDRRMVRVVSKQALEHQRAHRRFRRRPRNLETPRHLHLSDWRCRRPLPVEDLRSQRLDQRVDHRDRREIRSRHGHMITRLTFQEGT